tara:strand:- start:11238 stop:11417 length:180 start_codon:yes stop_codon:yes gene_type:complete
MDPAKRNRNLFILALIVAAVAVGFLKLHLYRSLLKEGFQEEKVVESVSTPSENEPSSQP